MLIGRKSTLVIRKNKSLTVVVADYASLCTNTNPFNRF